MFVFVRSCSFRSFLFVVFVLCVGVRFRLVFVCLSQVLVVCVRVVGPRSCFLLVLDVCVCGRSLLFVFGCCGLRSFVFVRDCSFLFVLFAVRFDSCLWAAVRCCSWFVRACVRSCVWGTVRFRVLLFVVMRVRSLFVRFDLLALVLVRVRSFSFGFYLFYSCVVVVAGPRSCLLVFVHSLCVFVFVVFVLVVLRRWL